METDDQEPRVDRAPFSVARLQDADDDQYWWSRSRAERLEATEIYRRIVYGYGADDNIRKSVEFLRALT